jgi:hypothetical protein
MAAPSIVDSPAVVLRDDDNGTTWHSFVVHGTGLGTVTDAFLGQHNGSVYNYEFRPDPIAVGNSPTIKQDNLLIVWVRYKAGQSPRAGQTDTAIYQVKNSENVNSNEAVVTIVYNDDPPPANVPPAKRKRSAVSGEEN